MKKIEEANISMKLLSEILDYEREAGMEGDIEAEHIYQDIENFKIQEKNNMEMTYGGALVMPSSYAMMDEEEMYVMQNFSQLINHGQQIGCQVGHGI